MKIYRVYDMYCTGDSQLYTESKDVADEFCANLNNKANVWMYCVEEIKLEVPYWDEDWDCIPNMFYPHLLARYETMLKTGESFYIDEFDNTEHLIWMINELRNNQDQSLTKKHRWLGYVQHAIISAGLTDVMSERDYTRDMFKGN